MTSTSQSSTSTSAVSGVGQPQPVLGCRHPATSHLMTSQPMVSPMVSPQVYVGLAMFYVGTCCFAQGQCVSKLMTSNTIFVLAAFSSMFLDGCHADCDNHDTSPGAQFYGSFVAIRSSCTRGGMHLWLATFFWRCLGGIDGVSVYMLITSDHVVYLRRRPCLHAGLLDY